MQGFLLLLEKLVYLVSPEGDILTKPITFKVTEAHAIVRWKAQLLVLKITHKFTILHIRCICLD